MKKLILGLIFLTIAGFTNAQMQENLKIVWPETYKWKIGSNQENASVHMIELIPGNESLEKWTMMGNMMSLKNVKISKTEEIVNIYKETSLKESPNAKLSVLESNDKDKNIWVLFKIETASFPNDPKPESQLYYVIQGEKTLYVNFVAIKEKKLSKSFTDKWSKIFKSSELIYR